MFYDACAIRYNISISILNMVRKYNSFEKRTGIVKYEALCVALAWRRPSKIFATERDSLAKRPRHRKTQQFIRLPWARVEVKEYSLEVEEGRLNARTP